MANRPQHRTQFCQQRLTLLSANLENRVERTQFRIGTFNLNNLALPETAFNHGDRYSAEEYQQKVTWTAQQLDRMNADGSPSDTISADYVWRPGTELTSQEPGNVQLPEQLENEEVRRSA